MSTPVAVRTFTDAFVNQGRPATNYVRSETLALRTSSGVNAYAYMVCSGYPVGSDVVIESAVLELHAVLSWSATTLTARQVTSAWHGYCVTYADQPTNTATGAVAVATGAVAAGGLIQVDITAMVQAWATGASPNYGVRLDVSSSVLHYLHAADSTVAGMKPVLKVIAHRQPPAPTGLVPSGGKQVSIARPSLRWTPSALPMHAQTAYQVQTNDTDVWTAPDYDSGTVVTTTPAHELTADIADTETLWWRVRVRNAGGQWSAYTAGQEFGRTDKPVVAITAPAGTASDSTPVVEWTVGGGSQTAYRVQYLSQVTGLVVVDSGILPGTALAWSSQEAVQYASGLASVRVDVWDDIDRVASVDDPIYASDTASFTYEPGATDPVTDLVMGAGVPIATALLTFSRDEIPDAFSIRKANTDGDFVDVPGSPFDGIDLHVSGTSFAWTDRMVRPRRDVTYQVVAVVNKIDSAAVEVTGSIEPYYIWLLDPLEPDWWIALADQDGPGIAFAEDSQVFAVHGSDRQQLTVDTLRGYEGTISGGVYESLPDVSGLSAQSLRDRVWHLKQHPTRIYRLVMSDMNIPVVVRNANVTPTPHAELNFKISFEVYQQGSVPWL